MHFLLLYAITFLILTAVLTMIEIDVLGHSYYDTIAAIVVLVIMMLSIPICLACVYNTVMLHNEIIKSAQHELLIDEGDEEGPHDFRVLDPEVK